MAATSLWAGGEVRVVSEAFSPPADLPVVKIDGHALPVYRIDNRTVGVRAPTAAGSYSVFVSTGNDTATLGPVTLHGFQGEAVGPFMSGQAALINPGETNPLVLSYGDSGTVVVDLNANAVVASAPDSVASPDCAQSPGPSYRGPTYFVVQGEVGGVCRTPQVWSLYPTATLVVDSSPISVFVWDLMAEVGPNRWFSEWNNHTYLWSCDSQPCNQGYGRDVGAYIMTLSPIDSTFIFTPSAYPGGPFTSPSVFRVSTMDTAYVVPSMGSIKDAVYSSTGDTLFSIGQEPSAMPAAYTPMHVTGVRVSDGAVVRDQPLDSLGYGAATQNFWAIAADPSGPWVYALTGYAVGSSVAPTLVVLDRATWSVAGVAVARGVSSSTLTTLTLKGQGWIIPAPGLHKVFVVVTWVGYNMHQHPGAVLTFDTP